MPGPAAGSSNRRATDSTAVALKIGAAAWASAAWTSKVFEESTMWDKDNIKEYGASRRDVVCAWLIAVAILGCLMLVTAVLPTASGQSTQEAKQVVAS